MWRVFLREGKYCVEWECNERRTYDPFDLQPDAFTVIRIMRYYGICNANPAFSSAYIQYLLPISLMQLYAGLQLTT